MPVGPTESSWVSDSKIDMRLSGPNGEAAMASMTLWGFEFVPDPESTDSPDEQFTAVLQEILDHLSTMPGWSVLPAHQLGRQSRTITPTETP